MSEGVKRFAGYGATEEDVERGFLQPGNLDRPEYDKINYAWRYSEPKAPDEDFGNTGSLPPDFEFRMKDRQSKGFLTRPRIPTER